MSHPSRTRSMPHLLAARAPFFEMLCTDGLCKMLILPSSARSSNLELEHRPPSTADAASGFSVQEGPYSPAHWAQELAPAFQPDHSPPPTLSRSLSAAAPLTHSHSHSHLQPSHRAHEHASGRAAEMADRHLTARNSLGNAEFLQSEEGAWGPSCRHSNGAETLLDSACSLHHDMGSPLAAGEYTRHAHFEPESTDLVQRLRGQEEGQQRDHYDHHHDRHHHRKGWRQNQHEHRVQRHQHQHQHQHHQHQHHQHLRQPQHQHQSLYQHHHQHQKQQQQQHQHKPPCAHQQFPDDLYNFHHQGNQTRQEQPLPQPQPYWLENPWQHQQWRYQPPPQLQGYAQFSMLPIPVPVPMALPMQPPMPESAPALPLQQQQQHDQYITGQQCDNHYAHRLEQQEHQQRRFNYGTSTNRDAEPSYSNPSANRGEHRWPYVHNFRSRPVSSCLSSMHAAASPRGCAVSERGALNTPDRVCAAYGITKLSTPTSSPKLHESGRPRSRQGVASPPQISASPHVPSTRVVGAGNSRNRRPRAQSAHSGASGSVGPSPPPLHIAAAGESSAVERSDRRADHADLVMPEVAISRAKRAGMTKSAGGRRGARRGGSLDSAVPFRLPFSSIYAPLLPVATLTAQTGQNGSCGCSSGGGAIGGWSGGGGGVSGGGGGGGGAMGVRLCLPAIASPSGRRYSSVA